MKKAAYITPAILSLAVLPSYAKAGSEKDKDKKKRQEQEQEQEQA